MKQQLFGVVGVDLQTGKVRLLGDNKTERNAQAIENMAIARNGSDKEFFAMTPAGRYRGGDEWEDVPESQT
jgi:hypothetical protein